MLAVSFGPAGWFRAEAGADAGVVAGTETTAVIFGFGFERTPSGGLEPGEANRFLLDWTLANHPQIETAFVQEGVWVALCAQTATECSVGGVRLLRIDRHDDALDLHTLDIAACAVERMTWFDIDEAVVVAHDLQLARAAENIRRVADEGLCPECRFSTAAVPDTPFPNRSDQLRTRHESLYRWVDLAARMRFSRPLTPTVPQRCPAPMDRPPPDVALLGGVESLDQSSPGSNGRGAAVDNAPVLDR